MTTTSTLQNFSWVLDKIPDIIEQFQQEIWKKDPNKHNIQNQLLLLAYLVRTCANNNLAYISGLVFLEVILKQYPELITEDTKWKVTKILSKIPPTLVFPREGSEELVSIYEKAFFPAGKKIYLQ